MRRLLLGVAVSALFAAMSLAQDTRGKVQGIVTDSSNAVIGGASVTLRNEDTAVQAQAQTGQAGQYLFDFVLPGHYTVTVEMAGFKQYMQRNILEIGRASCRERVL